MLTDLLKKSPGKRDLLEWSKEYQLAFEHLKKLICNPKVLYIFDPLKPIALFTDWSPCAIGGWIGQPSQSNINVDEVKIADF